MKYLVLIACLLVSCSGTRDNVFLIGDGTAGDKEIIANNGSTTPPKMAWDQNSASWQFSNDGVTSQPLGGGGSSQELQYGEDLNALDAVEIRDDGKAYKLSGFKDIVPFSNVGETNSDQVTALGYHEGSDTYVKFRRELGGSRVKATSLIRNDDNGAFTNGLNSSGPTAISIGQQITACSDGFNDQILISWENGSAGHSRLVDVVGGNPVFGNAGSAFLDYSVSNYPIICDYDPQSQKMVNFYSSTASNNRLAMDLINTQTGTPVYESTGTLVITDVINDYDVAYDTTNQVWLIIGNDTLRQVKARILDLSTGSIVLGPEQTIAIGTDAQGVSVSYDSSSDRFVLFYNDRNEDEVYAQLLQVTGTTVSPVGTRLFIEGQATQSFGSIAGYDAANGRTIVAVKEERIFSVTSTPTTLAATNTGLQADWGSRSRQLKTRGDGILYHQVDGSDFEILQSGISYGLNTESYVGVAEESGLTDEIKKVSVPFNSLSGFTSQTPGSIAYIQNDSTITTNETAFKAGVFKSATELYVNPTPKNFVTEYYYEVVDLNGNNNILGSPKCEFERINKRVTMTCDELSFSPNNTNVRTDANTVPSWARPVPNRNPGSAYGVDSSGVRYNFITNTNQIQWQFLSFSGSFTTRGNTGKGSTLTYLVD